MGCMNKQDKIPDFIDKEKSGRERERTFYLLSFYQTLLEGPLF